ncbi:MAG: YihY/virulence factor BrkB family protein [Balneolaceae bacterium]|nr:YihY/virulence factor BrkB family protein [Balneolaceae bacterium]
MNKNKNKMRLKGLRHIVSLGIHKETFRSFFSSDMPTYSSAVAFQMLFAVVPFIIIMITILGFFDLEWLYQILHDHSDVVIPGDAAQIVEQVIDEIEKPAGGLISIVLLIALWLASSAFRSVTHALNIVHKVDESRPFWTQFPLSIIYTIAIALMLILALLFMIVGSQVLEWIASLVNLDNIFIVLWKWLRWPIAAILLMITVAFIYFTAPNKRQKFKDIIPGSVLSVLVWIALSIGFDLYMRTFVDLSILYGSLGAIIFLLIYFYISSAVLLYSAKLNVVIESRSSSF